LASALASRVDGCLVEADDFHSVENKAKMASGTPLTDEDRSDWLRTLNRRIRALVEEKNSVVVVACSALKRRYRKVLFEGTNKSDISIVFLFGSKQELNKRLEHRTNHFLNGAKLLESQFLILEEPTTEEEFRIVVPIPIEENREKQLKLAMRAVGC
jgi:gluconokinase